MAEQERLVTAIPERFAHMPDVALEKINEAFASDPHRRQRATAKLEEIVGSSV
jgi:hypothetical protein